MLPESGARALTGQASVLLAGQAAAAALTVVCMIVLARALGASAFGQFALIAALVLIVSQLLDARSWEAATRFASEHLAAGESAMARASIEMAHGVNLAGGLIASAIVVVLAGPIASELLGDTGLSAAVVVYAAVAPFVALQNAAAIAFRLLADYRTLAVLTAATAAMRLAFAVVALALGAGVTGVVAALAIAEGVAAVACVGVAQRLMNDRLFAGRPRARVSAAWRELRRGWRVIAASNVHGTLRLANEQLDVVIVGLVATPAAAGTLKIARTFAQPPVMLQKPFYEAIYPRLTAARAGARLNAEWELIARLTPFAGWTLVPIAIAIAAAAPWLVPALAGAAFADAWQALTPIVLTTAVVGTLFWLHPAALATGLQGRSVTALALGTVLQVAAVVALVPAIGIAGAGIGYAIAMAVWIGLLAPGVRRRLARGADPEGDRLVVVGPTTPPFHGGAVMTERLLGVLRDRDVVAAHLDTRDPRPLDSIGRLDPRNAWLGIKHSVEFALLLVRCPGAGVYVPISQSRWGFTRDAVFLLIARLARRRRIVHLHGGYFRTFYRDSGAGMRFLIRAALAGVDQAWVLTDGLRGMFDGLVPEDRVRVVSNAVEDPPFGKLPEPGSEALRILYVSNLVPGKGWDHLITAVERIAERTPPLPMHLRLVGEVPTDAREEIRSRAGELAASGIRLELLGTRAGEAKVEAYRWADVFVYPSTYRYDGQPLVLLEAMAAGLAIITSSMGGIPDTVSDGETAVVIAPGNVDGLVQSIERAARDASLRRRLGDAARRRYLARYTPSHFAATVADLIGPNGSEGAARTKSPPRDHPVRPRPPTRPQRRSLRT